ARPRIGGCGWASTSIPWGCSELGHGGGASCCVPTARSCGLLLRPAPATWAGLAPFGLAPFGRGAWRPRLVSSEAVTDLGAGDVVPPRHRTKRPGGGRRRRCASGGWCAAGHGSTLRPHGA